MTRDHCLACKVARELREHRDATYPDWSNRRGMLNFAATIAQSSCPETPVVERDSRSPGVESETNEGRNPGTETDPLATVSTTPKGA